MNIVFMGTPDFSVPTLKKLHSDSDINIKYVVTKIDSKSNRGQKINFSDVKKASLELGIPILQPEKIKDDKVVIDKIKNAKPDYIIVVAYGQILSKEILDIPKYACINGHASLLPKYRGASPIQSAILAGDNVTGSTSMLMDVGLDTGDILEQNSINIDKKETSDSLFDKLSVLTAETIYHTIKNFNNIKPIKQDEGKVSKSIIIKKEFGHINFENETAVNIDRKIRAYTSWPSAYIDYGDSICKIWDVDIVSSDEERFYDNAINNDNVKILQNNIYVINGLLIVKCKTGYLKINELQKSGKNRMKSKDFINGLK